MGDALVVAGGYDGEPHRTWYFNATRAMADLLQGRGFRVVHLFPEPLEGVEAISTASALRRYLSRMSGGDPFVFFAVGHGNYDPTRGGSTFRAADREVGMWEIGEALAPDHHPQLLIFTPCKSGGFQALARPNRLVITSTEAWEDNSAPFAEALQRGLLNAPDVAAAFEHARREVGEWYGIRGKALREHPKVSDPELARRFSLAGAPAK